MTSRLSADCQKVGDQVQLNVQVFFRSLIQAVITLVWMFVIVRRAPQRPPRFACPGAPRALCPS